MVAFSLVIALSLLFPADLAGPALLALTVLLPLSLLPRGPARWAGQMGLGAAVVLVQIAYGLAHRPPPAMEGHDLELVGRIVDLVEESPGRLRFLVEPERIQPWPESALLPRRIQLTQYGGEAAPAAGERWRWTVRLKRPRGFRNPVSFDYESWLAARHVDATGYVRSSPEAARLTAGEGLAHWRAAISASIDGALPDGRSAAVIQALVVADRRAFDDELWELFRATGTSHLMAISGLHVGLVAGLFALLTLLLYRVAPAILLRWPRRDIAALTGFAGAFVYAALAGFAVPTLRALLMLGIAVVALHWRWRISGSSVLAITAALVLAADPWAALSPGFWLSFGAVALIIAVTTGRSGDGRLGGLLRVQWAVGIGMLPLSLGYFGQVSWIGLAVNLIAIPVFSVAVVPLALGGTLLLGVWPAAGAALLTALGAGLDWILVALEWAADAGDAFDLSALVQGLPIWFAAAMALLLVYGGLRFRLLACIAGLALAGGLLESGVESRPELRMTVFEVGQGTAVLVETDGRRLLFDTGPAWGSGANAAAFTLVPYLRENGVDFLDRVIVSHDDRDHSGGLEAVLQAVRVGRLRGGEALAAAPAAGRCRAGTHWRWGAAEFRLLWPPPGAGLSGNSSSCVLEIRVAGRTLLLTGDIEAPVEPAVARELNDRVDVLLVPHHGSASSSTPALIAAARPIVAIIPLGHRNAYDFPDRDVLRRYHCAGAAVYQTGRDGAVIVDIDIDGALAVTGWRAATRRLHHESGGRGDFRRSREIHYDADRSADHSGRHLEPCGN